MPVPAIVALDAGLTGALLLVLVARLGKYGKQGQTRLFSARARA